MTIKQIADELGVSKTAVRNYMNEDFRAKYTEKDCKGVILVSPEGCKLIAESLGKTENERKESAETEFVTIPRSVLSLLEKQLADLAEENKKLTAALTAENKELVAAVKAQAQSINADRHNELAGTMQKQLPDGSGAKWWQFWK